MAPMLDFDRDYLENAADGSIAIHVPPGTYRAEIAEIIPRVSKSGDEQWGIKLAVENPRATIWDNLTFNAKSGGRVRAFAGAIGIHLSGKQVMTEEGALGQIVMITVEDDQYDGKIRSKVKFDGYARPGGAARDPSQSPRPPADFAEEPAEDEEIPF